MAVLQDISWMFKSMLLQRLTLSGILRCFENTVQFMEEVAPLQFTQNTPWLIICGKVIISTLLYACFSDT